MKYFENVKTLEDLKKQYKDLVKKLHPDLSKKDTTKEFIAMKKEYEKLFKKVKDKFVNQQGEYYEQKNYEAPDEYTDVIDQLIKISGINIEIIGTWIWVTGTTKDKKDDLAKLHFRWSHNKEAWYYHTGGYKKKSGKNYSLDEIREMWGNEKIKEQLKLEV